MSFSPNLFTAHLKTNNGIATNGNFLIEIQDQGKQETTMMCHTASIMGKSLNANSQIYGYGSEYNLPVNEAFEDLSLSFNTTLGKNGELPERTFFNNWFNEVIDPNTNMVGFKSDYAKDINVYILKADGKKGYHQKFIKAIPLTMSDIELNSGTQEVISFDVTFTYDNWLENDRIDM